MVIGLELDHLKRAHGFQGPGRRASFLATEAAAPHGTWAEFCRLHAGINDGTAKTYLDSALALKNRLSVSTWKHAQWLIGQMEKRPSELPEAELANMIECIAGEVFDSSAKVLVEELRAVEARDIPDSLPEARAKVIRAEAILEVMKTELGRREQRTKAGLALKAYCALKAAGRL